MMEQLNITIAQLFDAKVEKVFASTGSMHTKQDVIELLSSLLVECKNAIHDYKAPESNNGYSLEDITNVFEKLDLSDYASVDRESAEMSMGWNNQVELDSADIDWESDTLLDDLISGLKELTAQAEGVEETIIIED